MNKVTGPYVRFECVKCQGDIERQISRTRPPKDEISDLIDGRGLTCAECWADLETRHLDDASHGQTP
jgi:hypothetical protein